MLPFRVGLFYSAEFLFLAVVASMLFTAFCFTMCVLMCWYGRHLTNKMVNRQIREVKEGMGVTISGVKGGMSMSDLSGRDMNKGT